MEIEHDTLIISGGGINGFVILGAIQYLYDIQKISNIQKYIGTSIGCAICYLLIIGLTPIEIMARITKEKTLDNFKHVKIKNILTGNGLFEWKHIDDFLLNITLEKCEQPLTFKDIYDLYGVKFVCCTYNITQKQIEYISVDNYPELSCLSAIRMSCNVPLLFSRYCYNDNYYIDGGIIDNFCISYAEPDDKILGIYLLPSTSKMHRNSIDALSNSTEPTPTEPTPTEPTPTEPTPEPTPTEPTPTEPTPTEPTPTEPTPTEPTPTEPTEQKNKCIEGNEDHEKYNIQSYLMEIIATPITYHTVRQINEFLNNDNVNKNNSEIIILSTIKNGFQFTEIDTLEQLNMFSSGYNDCKNYFTIK
jgi:predicted acylesterase/phospholipase RssA